MNLGEARITILGLGLMGGSLAQALRGKVASIRAVDKDPESLAYALENQIVDHVTQDAAMGLQQCDLVILSVPVGAIVQIIDRIGHDLPAPKYLMDLGSTKVDITEHMKMLPDEVDSIGGHPLCGKESAGVQASDPGLFQGKKFVLTPIHRTSREFLALSENLVHLIGATPLILEPEEHDRSVALTSHLPYLISASLTQTVMEAEGSMGDLRGLIASGFSDTTRIAASEVQMIADVLLSNRANVLEGLQEFSGILATMQKLLEQSEPDPLYAALEPILRWRQSLQSDLISTEGSHGA